MNSNLTSEPAQDGRNGVRRTKSETAYERLRDMIVTLELEPGALLDEAHLMDRLELGRTPIREAIQRLTLERLVVARPGSTPFVASTDMFEIKEIIECRHLVEVEAVRLACERMTREQIQLCRTVIDRHTCAAAAKDFAACVAADYEFHHLIAEGSHNRLLERAIDHANHLSQRLWYLSFKRMGALEVAHTHHGQMVDFIEAGDARAAQQVMRDHVEVFRVRMLAIM